MTEAETRIYPCSRVTFHVTTCLANRGQIQILYSMLPPSTLAPEAVTHSCPSMRCISNLSTCPPSWFQSAGHIIPRPTPPFSSQYGPASMEEENSGYQNRPQFYANLGPGPQVEVLHPSRSQPRTHLKCRSIRNKSCRC
jgi:hypothetical protein